MVHSDFPFRRLPTLLRSPHKPPSARTQTMDSDEEADPFTIPSSQSQGSNFQSLLFPRNRSQVFMPLTSPASRRNSRRLSYSSHPEYRTRRSQALLERNNFASHPWERFRKSEDELKQIKNKKVRRFYDNQVQASPLGLIRELSYR